MNYHYNYSVGGAGAVIWSLLVIAFYVVVIIGLWKTFVKAGHPGWAAIIPFYNLWIWIKIAGRPTSWFWIMLVGALLGWIPIIGWILIIAIWVMSLFLALDVAKNFGQGTGFGILLWLFSAIMYLVLGFGNYQYRQVAHPEMAGAGGGYAPPPPPPPGQPAAPSANMAPPAVPAQAGQPVMAQPLGAPPAQTTPAVPPAPPVEAAAAPAPPVVEPPAPPAPPVAPPDASASTPDTPPIVPDDPAAPTT